MDEARAVLARLERIEALDRARVDPALLLGELRELVHEAEAWARREHDADALEAAHRLAGAARARPDEKRATLVTRLCPQPIE
jgi:hypothetical protein